MLSDSPSLVTYTGNGLTSVWSLPFVVTDPATVQVLLTSPSGLVSQVDSGLFRVSPSANVVTYPLTGPALASGWQITISRVLPLSQPTAISDQGVVYPSVIEASLDRLTMQLQQLRDLVARAVTAPPGSNGAAVAQQISTAAVVAQSTLSALQTIVAGSSGSAALQTLQLVPLWGGAVVAVQSATPPAAGALNLATLAGVLWHDTGANLLRLRDQANTAWITLGTLNETAKTFVPSGLPTLGNGLALDGAGAQTLKLADSSLTLTAAGLALTPTTPPPHVRRSQVVLSASGDNNCGTPFLIAGTGLAVSLLATAVPVIIAFANGFGPHGEEDFIATISIDSLNCWSGLPPNATVYLYIDRNVTTGALSCGYSLLPFIAQQGGSTPVSSGQHCYRIDQRQCWLGNGTQANAVQRVPVGQCQTNGSGIVAGSLVVYALQGRAISGQLPLSGTSLLSFAHNIGTDLVLGIARLTALTAIGQFSAGQRINNWSNMQNNSGYVTDGPQPDCQALTATLQPGGASIAVSGSNGLAAVVAPGAYATTFTLQFILERHF